MKNHVNLKEKPRSGENANFCPAGAPAVFPTGRFRSAQPRPAQHSTAKEAGQAVVGAGWGWAWGCRLQPGVELWQAGIGNPCKTLVQARVPGPGVKPKFHSGLGFVALDLAIMQHLCSGALYFILNCFRASFGSTRFAENGAKSCKKQ